ncbi:hypothetical protein F2Q69_00041260 [Brassica cretica]|uniref:Uncharacterized protein n=1 Tax=Brassica cretica TaxID=69181 RepID=A0A8S9NDG6_BRACR|nr:hypothetical protein F2Q69_00041260 [Brassica cretica]
MVERGGERGTEHGGDRGTFGRGFSSRGGGRGGPRRGRRHHGGRPRREMDTSHQARSSRSERDQTDRAIPRASWLELRLEPRPDDRTDRTGARLSRPTRHSKPHGRARLSLGREETEDGYAFSFGGPSGQSRKRPYLYPVHPSGSDEPEHCLKGPSLTNLHGRLIPEVLFAFLDHIQHPAKVILQSKAYQVVSKPLWLG